MWAIWAKQLLPPALKSCLKCNKSPDLVTLLTALVECCCNSQDRFDINHLKFLKQCH